MQAMEDIRSHTRECIREMANESAEETLHVPRIPRSADKHKKEAVRLAETAKRERQRGA